MKIINSPFLEDIRKGVFPKDKDIDTTKQHVEIFFCILTSLFLLPFIIFSFYENDSSLIYYLQIGLILLIFSSLFFSKIPLLYTDNIKLNSKDNNTQPVILFIALPILIFLTIYFNNLAFMFLLVLYGLAKTNEGKVFLWEYRKLLPFIIPIIIYYLIDKDIYSLNRTDDFKIITNTVTIFIFLTVVLRAAGIKQILSRIAFQLASQQRIGFNAAFFAILNSWLYGMFTGSARGNITETAHDYTYRAMLTAGYTPQFTALLIAIASTSGQITPPIMGAISLIILHKIENITYSNIIISTFSLSFLFFMSMLVIAFIQARIDNITLKELIAGSELKEEIKPQNFLLDWTKIVILFVILFVFSTFSFSFFEKTTLLFAMVIILIMSLQKKEDKGKFIFRILAEWGKDVRFLILLSFLLLTIIESALNIKELWIVERIPLHLLETTSPLFSYLIKPLMILLISGVLIILNSLLPTIAVFLLTAPFISPILENLGFNALSSYLFIFYYSALAGLTPIFNRNNSIPPYIKSAWQKRIKDENNEFNESQDINLIKRLIYPLYLLPIIWLFHPALHQIPSTLTAFYLLISIIVIMIGVYSFTLYNKEIPFFEKTQTHFILFLIIAYLLCLPTFIVFILSGVIFLILLLINSRRSNSSLKTAFDLAFNLAYRQLSLSIILSLATLTLVYTVYITGMGYYRYFKEENFQHWLNSRYHFLLHVNDCQDLSQIKRFIKENTGYDITAVCTKTANVFVARTNPTPFIVFPTIAVEFKPELAQLLPNFYQNLQKNYQEEIESYRNAVKESCFLALEKSLTQWQNNKLDMQKIRGTNCETEQQYPIAFVGSDLTTNSYNILPYQTITLLSTQIVNEKMPILIAHLEHNAEQSFLVLSYFDTENYRDSDINKLIFVPEGSLNSIYKESQLGIDNSLFIKVQNISNLEDLKTIIQYIKSPIIKNKLDYYGISESIIGSLEDEYILKNKRSLNDLDNALNILDSLFILIVLLTFIILLTTLILFFDKNRKIFALARIAGLPRTITFTFLIIVSLCFSVFPIFLAIFLNTVVNIGIAIFIPNITFSFSIMDIILLLVTVILLALLSSLILYWRFFFKSIISELLYVRQQS
ncbi:TRAP-type uncharacterized transport system, fused permease component [Beggiatoa alba B18LD]|uniref:TRAP-type uncharacterized transport system, fused permease component n=1 Tax=Beggiatoa alba B18LD TaxID=395493 RepID=I3CJ64_9GAMM|nr:TRAP transporter large permease subunit [Beggiatoa alba]EIJ43657.1 TRAP-type uncharacterized transport system, fused permease component [Beggiatoa alba B18LD]